MLYFFVIISILLTKIVIDRIKKAKIINLIWYMENVFQMENAGLWGEEI